VGRGKSAKAKLQEQILRQRGLENRAYKGLATEELPPPDSGKTLAMRLMEARFGTPIAVLLSPGTLKEVATFLGIDESTVSKWRLRLGLRSTRVSN